MEKEKFCSCGCNLGAYHLLGAKECYRKEAIDKLIPTDFRKENNVEVCTVNGYTITVYTLYNQRLYSFENNVCWSLPKDENTTISIGENL